MSDLVPLAIGIAASPFSVIPVILLLLTPRALATSSSYLVGWVVGIAAVATAFVFFAGVIGTRNYTPTWISWTRVGFGAVLVALGIRRWLRRNAPADPPKWMSALESVGPGRALRLGLLLAVANPKIFLLSAAGGLAIGTVDQTPYGVAGSVAIFTALASSTVAIPVVLFAILRARILPPLATSRDWLLRNNAAVMAVVFAVIGIALAAKGIAEL